MNNSIKYDLIFGYALIMSRKNLQWLTVFQAGFSEKRFVPGGVGAEALPPGR
jgi:hypothetical protein